MCRIKFILFLIPPSPPPDLPSSVPSWTPSSSHLFRLSCLSLLTPLPLYLLLCVDFHSFLQVCLAISVMLQNLPVCLEIKTLVDMWLCTSGMIFPFFAEFLLLLLRLCLVITFYRKVRVTLLFSDSSLSSGVAVTPSRSYTSFCV